jgi:hypothetical protein
VDAMTRDIPKSTPPSQIRSKILTIRGEQVILDRDLSLFYQVETRILKQSVRRNMDRFPDDFMFQLTNDEISDMVSQFVIPSKGLLGGSKPYVFTESGVSMLASVIRTPIAVEISIKIIRAFVSMRHQTMNSAPMFKRISEVEEKQVTIENKLEELLKALESKEIKIQQGIFFEDKVFDAYLLITKLVKLAKKSIILIDNYVDDDTLVLFSERNANISCDIYTSNITQKLKLSLKKFNDQYPTITLKQFVKSHDRFLVIDKCIVYHIGASLKDLGKKWFAITRLNIDAQSVLEKLE